MQKIKNVRYVRYMDDWIIVAKKRHHLKKAIKKTYEILKSLKLEISRPKTEIDKMTKVFTFLGYQLGTKKLALSEDSQNRASEKIVRLYEQGASKKRIEQYLTRWHNWARAGLSACATKLELPSWMLEFLDILKNEKPSSRGSLIQGKYYEQANTYGISRG